MVAAAKVVAARRGTSVSGLVAAVIREAVAEDGRYERAMGAALHDLRAPADLGGGEPVDRSVLHAR